MADKFKVGDRVQWNAGEDRPYGMVTVVVGGRFEVEWSDGESYTYTDWAGGSVRKVDR